MSATASRRSLHWVFKIGNRKATMDFYKNVLGMKVLRHEEFEKGCEAACNGPYDGKWSKTMIGYGPESDHFVVELTYNYNISQYIRGNDFQGITIQSDQILTRAAEKGHSVQTDSDGLKFIQDPDGYKFIIIESATLPPNSDPVKSVGISVSDLGKSVGYWNQLLGMDIVKKDDKSAELSYGNGQASLVIKQIDGQVEHKSAGGRVAFALPRADLPPLEQKMKDENTTILTPLVTLDTPGKASVDVVILADPDGTEICFVGEEGFSQLSQVDPQGDELLEKALAEDKSDEWFAKKGREKITQ